MEVLFTVKILAPLNNIYIDDYINAGAEEFYAGIHDENWTKEYGIFCDLNRMSGFGVMANPFNIKQLCELADTIRNKGASLYATFNAPIYSQKQIILLESMFNMLSSSGCKGVIVSCPDLIPYVLHSGMECVASTICGIYNSFCAEFYKSAGCKRIILPRDLSLNEIQDIVEHVSGIEFEVFLMRNGCVFSDSYCLGIHRKECGSLCGSLRSIGKNFVSSDTSFTWRHDAELNEMVYSKYYHVYSCGQCALYRLLKTGINAVKIVGRADERKHILEDIIITRKNINIAKSCNTEEEYLDNMIFPANTRYICKEGLSCYYPEIRF